jgi:hypothetical protein
MAFCDGVAGLAVDRRQPAAPSKEPIKRTERTVFAQSWFMAQEVEFTARDD